MEQSIAKIPYRRNKVMNVGKHDGCVGAGPRTSEDGAQSARPDQAIAHKLVIQHESPRREFRLGHHTVVVWGDMTSETVSAALLGNEFPRGLRKIIPYGLDWMRRGRAPDERSVPKFGTRPPEVPQMRTQCPVDGIAQGDLGSPNDGVDRTAHMGIPQVNTHQFNVVRGLEYGVSGLNG